MPSFVGVLSCSRLGDCPRRLAYSLISPREEVQDEPNPVFLEGHWHEFEVKQRINPYTTWEAGIGDEAYVEWQLDQDFKVHGHVDAIGTISASSGRPYLPRSGGRFIIEIKSMSPGVYWKFVKKGIPAHYYAQVQGYLASKLVTINDVRGRAGQNQAGIISMYQTLDVEYVPLSEETPSLVLFLAKNRDTGDIKATIVEPDYYTINTIKQRWLLAEERLQNNQLPDRLYTEPTSDECKRCPFKNECWSANGDLNPWQETDEPIREVTNPIVEDAVDQYVIGKVLVDHGTTLLTDARNRLEMNLQEGSYKTSNAKVKKFTRSNRKLDHDKLRSLLSEQEYKNLFDVTDSTVIVVDEEQTFREALERTVGEWVTR